MTTPAIPSDSRNAAYPFWVRVLLVIVALNETIAALADLPGIFYDYEHKTALLKFAQAVTSVRIGISPLIAAAALYFAIVGRIAHGVIALAILIIVAWLSELTSIAIHGLEFSRDVVGVMLLFRQFAFPLLAIVAIVMAVKNRLALATVLVSLPTFIAWLGVIAFAIGVSIYGF